MFRLTWKNVGSYTRVFTVSKVAYFVRGNLSVLSPPGIQTIQLSEISVPREIRNNKLFMREREIK